MKDEKNIMIKQIFSKKLWTAELLIVSFIWILLFTVPIIVMNVLKNVNWAIIQVLWFVNFTVFAVFLINRFIFIPYLLLTGKRRLYLSIITILVLIPVALAIIQPKTIRRNIPSPTLSYQNKTTGSSPDPVVEYPIKNRKSRKFLPFGFMSTLMIMILSFDTGIIIFVKWLKSEQTRILLQKELIENKMNTLQKQISPHFFMNTLNNIHALIDINSGEAKEAIIKLSNMMDFMLYETSTNFVSINKEFDFVNSYVELMRLRYPEKIDIQLQTDFISKTALIPPFLTIMFIENAFKYGISYQSDSFVHINMKSDKNQYCFEIKNSTHEQSRAKKHSGIGISNARNRLELIYGDKYLLDINQNHSQNTFEVKLNIPL